MVKKKDMKAALQNSLTEEDKAVNDRFAKADSVLLRGEELRGEKSLLEGEEAQTATASRSRRSGRVAEMAPLPQALVIRDSFTMPEKDYELIRAIQANLLKVGVHLNKSEILRAGLHALIEMQQPGLMKVAAGVEKVKTGRPK